MRRAATRRICLLLPHLRHHRRLVLFLLLLSPSSTVSLPRPVIPPSTRSTRAEVRFSNANFDRHIAPDAVPRDQDALAPSGRPRVSAWLLEPTEPTDHARTHTLPAYRTRAPHDTAAREHEQRAQNDRPIAAGDDLQSRTTLRVDHWRADCGSTSEIRFDKLQHSCIHIMAGSGKTVHVTVVLCKGLSEKNDRQETYVETLESAGYSCECLQTLRFEFVNISELRACLSVANKYSGLILTSPRTVEAVALAAKEDASILYHWEQMPAYCIGPATDSLARSQLKLQNCMGSQSGNSKRLAEKIVLDIKKDSKPLLYPCSEIARDTISCIVEDNGISIEKMIVYKTLMSETLEQELPKMLEKSPSIFVFFSPSTVEYIKVQLNKNFYNIKDIKAVAIGPVTRDALINSGFSVYATADKPEPVALMHAITAVKSMENLSKNVA